VNHYILIKPNDAMQALLAQHRYISMPAEIFHVQQHGRPILSIPDTIESYKLFFLAQMYDYMQMYKNATELHGIMTGEEDLRKYQFFRTLLGEPPYTRQLFDRWWTIERIIMESSYDKRLDKLPLSAFEVLEETESLSLADWIERMKEWKQRKSDPNTDSTEKENSDD
jgi:hypothetical protein